MSYQSYSSYLSYPSYLSYSSYSSYSFYLPPIASILYLTSFLPPAIRVSR